MILLVIVAFLVWRHSRKKHGKTQAVPMDVQLKKARGEARRKQFQMEYKQEHQGKTSAARYRACKKENRLKLTQYIVLDTETTGLSPESDQLIEIAALRIENNQIVDRYETLINPGCLLPREIKKLTGISTAGILLSPMIERAAPKLGEFIEGYPIVAYNAPFHVGFETAAFRHEGVYGNIFYVDVLELAREAFPNLTDYQMDTVLSKLGLSKGERKHRAMSDATFTYTIYRLCKKELIKYGRI